MGVYNTRARYNIFDPGISVLPCSDSIQKAGIIFFWRLPLRPFPRYVASMILTGAFLSSGILTGCAARVETGYTIHDGYYNDDHVWDDNELGFYTRWEGETHRRHVDFRRRSGDEQKEYFTWRHNHH